MILRYSAHFLKQYADAPLRVQRDFDKQSRILVVNVRHPSLRAKKYDEERNLWQGRVNGDWRFYFTIEDDEFRLHEIKPHPK